MSKYGRKRYDADIKRKEPGTNKKKDITSLVHIILKAIATLAKKDEDNKRFVPDEVWELGYHIAKRCTGNGYATEAVSAFLPVIAKAANLIEI